MKTATYIQSSVGTFGGYLLPDILQADTVANAKRTSQSNWIACQHVTDYKRTIYYRGALVKHGSWDNQTGVLELVYLGGA